PRPNENMPGSGAVAITCASTPRSAGWTSGSSSNAPAAVADHVRRSPHAAVAMDGDRVRRIADRGHARSGMDAGTAACRGAGELAHEPNGMHDATGWIPPPAEVRARDSGAGEVFTRVEIEGVQRRGGRRPSLDLLLNLLPDGRGTRQRQVARA